MILYFRSTNIRGILLTVTGISGTLGTLVVYSVGPYVSYAGTGWLGLGLTLVYVSSVMFIPESPVFQVMVGMFHAFDFFSIFFIFTDLHLLEIYL